MYKDLFDTGLIEKHNNLKCTVIETPKTEGVDYRCYTYVLCGYFPGYNKPIKKIGRSGNPGVRYQNITEFCPYPVFLDYMFYTPFNIESMLHKKFADKRVYNRYCPSGATEWFMGVDDSEIIAAFAMGDYEKPSKRIGGANVSLLDYSNVFKLDPGRYYGGNISYSNLLSSLDLKEDGTDTVPLLLDSIEILYYKYEREAIINKALQHCEAFE